LKKIYEESFNTNHIMSEGFGEDTYLTTEMVVAAVTGIQGDFEGLKSTHIGAADNNWVGFQHR
jgi:beta-glucosidase